jgi:hypothetical protein
VRSLPTNDALFQTLHEQLSEKQKKQIVFLYISIDANEESWKKGISELDIQGCEPDISGQLAIRSSTLFPDQPVSHAT